MTKPKQEEHYWICIECAEARGWNPVNWEVTMIEQECPYCDQKKPLACAGTDFIKNGKEPGQWD